MIEIENKRVIVTTDFGAYAVDVWTRSGSTYFAQAQQLNVDEYRVANANGSNEDEVIQEAVDKLIAKY